MGPEDGERTGDEREREAYERGLEDGLRMYAWWKDGTEYVGTCGTTLRDAIARALKEARR